jgi:hypothetical protein
LKDQKVKIRQETEIIAMTQTFTKRQLNVTVIGLTQLLFKPNTKATPDAQQVSRVILVKEIVIQIETANEALSVVKEIT